MAVKIVRAFGIAHNPAHALTCMQTPGQQIFPNAFGIGKTRIRLKRNAEETITGFFLPFTMATHYCTLSFTDKTQGSFCYELVGSVLLPSVMVEHQFTIDLNSPEPQTIQLAVVNQQLEVAKKLFMDSHPLAKEKEQLALAKGRNRAGPNASGVPTPCVSAGTRSLKDGACNFMCCSFGILVIQNTDHAAQSMLSGLAI
jgi:hypothetical protein